MKTIDVYGIGNPLIDLLAHVSDDYLKENGLEKDRMYLIDQEQQQSLLESLKSHEIIIAPGGSCANTMIGIGQLGGTAAFSGKIGDDEHGKLYHEKLEEAGVKSLLGKKEGVTGSSLVLVSNDGARTMNTFLGMCQALDSGDINEEAIQSSKYVYLTGYLWDTDTQKEAVQVAMEQAKKYKTKVAMSLSDPFCVNRHQADFRKLLRENVDLVFCNQEEAFALTETNVTQKAVDIMAQDVEYIVLTMGGRGALVVHNGHMTYIDPFSVDVVDTTGAGDAFAAGFLYGIAQGKSHLESGKIAAFLASKVIAQVGPRYNGDIQAQLQQI